jgi:hypothetical protein
LRAVGFLDSRAVFVRGADSYSGGDLGRSSFGAVETLPGLACTGHFGHNYWRWMLSTLLFCFVVRLGGSSSISVLESFLLGELLKETLIRIIDKTQSWFGYSLRSWLDA